jgi:RNA polymerase sigma-70 factor (ECF subfamily)
MKDHDSIQIQDCIDRFRGGQIDAFTELIHTVRSPVFSFILRLTGHRQTAEDVFQDTVVRVWKTLHTYKPSRSFMTWILTIAYHVAIDERRRRRPGQLMYSSRLPEPVAQEDSERALEQREQEQTLLRAVGQLPEHQRTVFLLRMHTDMTFKEIAAEMEQPLNTVLSHMNYAVRTLQNRFNPNRKSRNKAHKPCKRNNV